MATSANPVESEGMWSKRWVVFIIGFVIGFLAGALFLGLLLLLYLVPVARVTG